MALTTKTFVVNANQDHTVEAVGEPLQVTFTASARDGVDISPSGTFTVPFGTDQTFVVTAQPGFQIKEILVDGSPLQL